MEQSKTTTRIPSTAKRLLSSIRAAATSGRMLIQRTSALTWIEQDASQAPPYGDKSRLVPATDGNRQLKALQRRSFETP